MKLRPFAKDFQVSNVAVAMTVLQDRRLTRVWFRANESAMAQYLKRKFDLQRSEEL